MTTTAHLSGALLSQRAGFEGSHVPYRGAAQVIPTLLSGDLNFALDNLASYLPVIRVLRKLCAEGRHHVLTLGMTPVVTAQLDDPYCLSGMQHWLANWQLRALEAPEITPGRYFLMLETGDEVLDYRDALQRYAGCRQAVFDGGDHSFTRFPEMLPQLFEFCGL